MGFWSRLFGKESRKEIALAYLEVTIFPRLMVLLPAKGINNPEEIIEAIRQAVRGI